MLEEKFLNTRAKETIVLKLAIIQMLIEISKSVGEKQEKSITVLIVNF